jgi:ABC-type sugar transport system substrate-binding protein
MRRKKISMAAAAVLTAAMSVSLLAGCGSVSSSSESSKSSASSAASSASESAGSGTSSSSGAAVSGTASSSSADLPQGNGEHIKVVLKTLSSEYWNYVAAGCKAAGGDMNVQVDVVGPASETSYDEQQSEIETILNSGDADALVVAPQQSDTVATLIANTDLPVIAIDTNVESDKVLSFVGFDNKEMGAMGGKAAVEQAKKNGWDKITAIGIAGVQGDATSEDRLAGYVQGIEAAGGTCYTDETHYADGIADKAVTEMEGIIQTHPEGVAIVYCNNDDMAMGAARAAAGNDAYKNTVFLGCGGNDAALDSILEGKETMTVAVDGYQVGYTGVQCALRALQGETLEKFIATPASIVTKDNAEEQKKFVASRTNGTAN